MKAILAKIFKYSAKMFMLLPELKMEKQIQTLTHHI